FDPYLHAAAPQAGSDDGLPAFWSGITCPTMLCLGLDSWASNPVKDGRAAYFQDARLVEFADAGHWLHHDQFDQFIGEVRAFL
ncbi:MAG: alpha/beta hydrolase, partial [bacterium]|nr:alpha/beta hydrolase [bacterium]